ncbi:MAG: methyltransferase domain-containing protein [Alphaproteobacteria bacterium]|nr:methyltransferase domain-containing protein [Alphaproteobacteria bacterium]
MHFSALEFGRHFLANYWRPSFRRIVDIGARDVNGSLRQFCPAGSEYIGIDIAEGEGVDIVLADPYSYPFPAGSIDIVLSTSCLEHDQMFWLTFLEALRIVSNEGFVYFNVPSNGPYHGYPRDHWRFYADAAAALRAWGCRVGQPCHVIETFVGPVIGGHIWQDNVMIFSKSPSGPHTGHFLSEMVEGCEYVQNVGSVASLRA